MFLNDEKWVIRFIFLFLLVVTGSTFAIISAEGTYYSEHNNTLCVYNNNSNLSRSICDYYLTKRSGVRSLGIDIPLELFHANFVKSDNEVAGEDYSTFGEQKPVASGIIGDAYNFNGTSIIGGDYFNDTQDFSISAWVKLYDQDNSNGVFVNGNSNSYGMRFRLRVSDSNDSLWVLVGTGDGGDYIYAQGGNLSQLDEWHHVSIVGKSGEYVLGYINSNLVFNKSSGSISTGNKNFSFSGSNKLIIGSSSSESSELLNGSIDDVIFFNRTITGEEVSDIYNAGLDGNSSDLVNDSDILGYWPIDMVYGYEHPMEDMLESNFLTYVKQPILDWCNENNSSDIKYLAVAKGIPTTVSGKSGGHYLSANMSYGGANEFYRKVERFEPDNYENIYFATSYLIGYSFEDIKMMIDKAQSPTSGYQDVNWIIDMDEDGFSVILYALTNTRAKLLEVGINNDSIITDAYDDKINFIGDVIGYFGPGVYHTGYGGYNWVVDEDNFNFSISNRSILTSVESCNGATFTGSQSPNHRTDLIPSGCHQGLIADAMSNTSFGGMNYNKSFSGGMAHVGEPTTGGVAFSYYWMRAYASGMNLAESAMSSWYSFSQSSGGDKILVIGDPLMKITDEDLISLEVLNTDTNTPILNVTTEKNSTCKYSYQDLEYENMSSFDSSDGFIHSQTLSLSNAEYTYFVECNYSDLIINSTNISFLISAAVSTPVQSPGGGGGSSGQYTNHNDINESQLNLENTSEYITDSNRNDVENETKENLDRDTRINVFYFYIERYFNFTLKEILEKIYDFFLMK